MPPTGSANVEIVFGEWIPSYELLAAGRAYQVYSRATLAIAIIQRRRRQGTLIYVTGRSAVSLVDLPAELLDLIRRHVWHECYDDEDITEEEWDSMHHQCCDCELPRFRCRSCCRDRFCCYPVDAELCCAHTTCWDGRDDELVNTFLAAHGVARVLRSHMLCDDMMIASSLIAVPSKVLGGGNVRRPSAKFSSAAHMDGWGYESDDDLPMHEWHLTPAKTNNSPQGICLDVNASDISAASERLVRLFDRFFGGFASPSPLETGSVSLAATAPAGHQSDPDHFARVNPRWHIFLSCNLQCSCMDHDEAAWRRRAREAVEGDEETGDEDEDGTEYLGSSRSSNEEEEPGRAGGDTVGHADTDRPGEAGDDDAQQTSRKGDDARCPLI